ncbi:MAG: hypothetical protein GC185_07750 [Alphaproteobacteria bacterium]|nr:hypothetical protein [Alphaproteobacteria bacterium]
MFCYSNDGLSLRRVPHDYAPQAGEITAAAPLDEAALQAAFPAYADAQARRDILARIYELEARQTPRRLREALAGTDGGWMAALESEISALRAQIET